MEIDLALTILRVSLGLTLAAHGYNKFFKGGKIEGTGRWFDSMGMRPGTVSYTHLTLPTIYSV